MNRDDFPGVGKVQNPGAFKRCPMCSRTDFNRSVSTAGEDSSDEIRISDLNNVFASPSTNLG
jgi:hypothetical protein